MKTNVLFSNFLQNFLYQENYFLFDKICSQSLPPPQTTSCHDTDLLKEMPPRVWTDIFGAIPKWECFKRSAAVMLKLLCENKPGTRQM